ncbi:DNA (cytosine-5)-methyltransferase 3A [Acropora cervicornis]|uniref:DNA (cytosine-5-)-methyltransferase n=1 Tax=Acropora cervicornis TaxID=6130 RepID=A0AAD9QZD7_ACRCE|nr:DNA (cytosine-5)-methyltransferase 3A [Acropora cervicornis]
MEATPTSEAIQAPKKKPKFKRRLEFSASDYKSKKKIRVKSDVFISVTSVEDNHLATSSDDHLSTSDDENGATFVHGQLIWGRLKGYDWWPGLIVSHLEAQKAPPALSNHWIKWFGDNKLSLLPFQCLRPFSKFKESLIPSKMRGIYKRAVFDSLETKKKTATRRAKAGPEQIAGLHEDQEPLGERERQEMMVQWAMNGFKPNGPKGFAPTEDVMISDTSVSVTSFMDVISSDDSESTAEHKSRFGKPVNVPNLAENIKVLLSAIIVCSLICILHSSGICLACGDLRVCAKHPLFKGGLCKECKTSLLGNIYLYDEDGSQMYCTICGDGKEVFMCDNDGCFRSYCNLCIGMLCGVNAVRKIAACETWVCFMCSSKTQGLISPRQDWSARLQEHFMNDKEQEFVAKVQHGRKIQHIGDIQKISRDQIQDLGPFDFVFGGSPCNDLSIANPIRRGIYEGTGRLFFDFFRLLEYARPKSELERPFFWLFENVVGMRAEDKAVISRFLECNPVVVDAKEISPAHRARYFWGNLPGMNRPTIPLPGDKLCLQDCLEPNCGRQAKFTKVQTLTTNANSMLQTKKSLLPVQYVASDGHEKEDILLFGLPSHYTDVSNMGRSQRQRLLGKSWSVPVIRHLLSPLKDYYKCET